MSNPTKPTTVDEYIRSFPTHQQAKLSELRQLILATVPNTTETLKWGNPAIIDEDGMILVVFAGYKDHMNLVATPSTKDALASKLTDYTTGKGSVQLQYDKPLPKPLIKEFVMHRAREYRGDGVKWK